ncbi:MAG: DivIVA domain-containing protein, partial [Actinomycetota bacterium]|nr:DivIVA domain-containing protein [Actinomycetota bacterium]
VQAAEARAAEAERRASDSEHRTVGTAEADETLKRTLVLAQRTADAAIREAEERAARTIADAEDQASRMLSEAQETSANAYAAAEAEARQSQAEARAKVLNELNELEAMRHQLRHDVELMERHLEQQRERVRVTIHDLQRLLDNPGALREASVPTFNDLELPAHAFEEEPSFEPEPAFEETPRPLQAPPMPPEAPPRRLVAEPMPAPTEDDEWDNAGPPQWSQAEPEVEPDPSEYEPMPPAPTRRGPQRARSVEGVLRAGEQDDDAYLAELRKAMDDDRPLGPRDEYYDDGDVYEDEPAAPRSRFGRRR